MALHADTGWEVRAEGNNNNSGGWHDAGGASADHSQQDAHNETWTNLSIAGTTLTDDDAGGKFTASMLGNIINALTAGRFEISTVTDSDNVELDRAPGNDTGLTGYEGGAVADLEQIDSVVVNGNIIHVKAGTYVAAGAISFAVGTTTSRITLLGYNASRGDNPRDDNRPLLTMGANGFTLNNYNWMENFRATTTHSSGIYLPQYAGARNVKSENTGVNATDRAFRTGPATLIDCEAICGNGIGIFLYSLCKVLFCKVHDCLDGIQCYTNAAYSLIAYNIIKDCTQTGLFADGCHNMRVLHNNFDDCDKGIDTNTVQYWLVINNQFTSCTTYGLTFDAESHLNFLDGNNWSGNGDDVNNCTKGAGATANAPGYAGEDDFSGVDDTGGIVMLLGVG